MSIANKEDLVRRYEGLKFNALQPVLDIGGGNGAFLESQGINKATIIDATIDRNKKYDYIYADLTKKLPKIKKKFKTIFITEVLEHLPNPLYLLAQAYELLDEKGTCYISIPYTEIAPDHHHVCRWTKKEIVEQTKKLGFSPRVIQARRRFGGLGFFLPHCWLVLELTKQRTVASKENIKSFKLDV